ncbi:MAG: hypothetical protein AAF840_15920 [Bacteroidota bacterium]
MRLLFLLFSLLFFTTLQAQYTGEVNYEAEGVAFTIPPQWVGQEMEDVFVMGSEQEAGLMVLMFHEATTLAALKVEMQAGLQEASVSLMPVGAVEQVSTTKVAGHYRGTLEGQAVRGKAIALLNPYGQGLVVFSLIAEADYAKRTDQLADLVANSVRFSPTAAGFNTSAYSGLTVEQVRQDLSGNQLYFNEYYGSRTAGGGGYEINKTINLCPNGTFTYYGDSYLSIPDPDHDPYLSSGKGHGRYSFVKEEGKVYLQLKYIDGHITYLHVTYEDNKTHLDGGRYYVLEVECY